MKLLFLDTETTGLEAKKNGITQISGVIEIDGEVKEEFDFKVRPFERDEVTEAALNVQGVTKEDLQKRMAPAAAYQSLILILRKYVDRFSKFDKFILVGHNVKFDYDFVTEWFRKNGDPYFYSYVFYHLIDTMSIATFFKLSKVITPKNMKLGTLADHFGIPLKAHDSMEDIRATREIFYKLSAILKGQFKTDLV